MKPAMPSQGTPRWKKMTLLTAPPPSPSGNAVGKGRSSVSSTSVKVKKEQQAPIGSQCKAFRLPLPTPGSTGGAQATTTSSYLFSPTGTPDFVKCVAAAPFVPSHPSVPIDDNTWFQLEWKARAKYWQETAEHLVHESDHYQKKSQNLSSQLMFCTQALQNQTEQSGKDQQALLDRLQVVQDENSRLASLLSTYISKARAHDDLKAKVDSLVERDRLSTEEKAGMQAVLDTMSDTLQCYLAKSSDEEDETMFCGGFFAVHPCDGPVAEDSQAGSQ